MHNLKSHLTRPLTRIVTFSNLPVVIFIYPLCSRKTLVHVHRSLASERGEYSGVEALRTPPIAPYPVTEGSKKKQMHPSQRLTKNLQLHPCPFLRPLENLHLLHPFEARKKFCNFKLHSCSHLVHGPFYDTANRF